MSSSGKKLTKKQQQQILKDQQLVLNSSTSNPSNPDASTPLDLTDQSLYRKQAGQFEIVPNSLLDIFDAKYSCSHLSVHEQHDLFYSDKNQDKVQEFGDSDDHYFDEPSFYSQKKSVGSKNKHLGLKTATLNMFDENKSGFNVLKRLIKKTKMNKSKLKMTQKLTINENNSEELATLEKNDAKLNNLIFMNKSCVSSSSFLYHNWLYEKKDIKSNVELTKSLKHIQPLLEETVQKKYTTSKMWESFQGPLTWQHFCRLAFKVC